VGGVKRNYSGKQNVLRDPGIEQAGKRKLSRGHSKEGRTRSRNNQSSMEGPVKLEGIGAVKGEIIKSVDSK